ncbi:unnamed protein product [Moneuplotes crassus]|uniref:Macro domain-containing protein n=1 Tax=Euplotes crassus TaxID=5936 RepID=A0AAD2D7E0_EUPCR|nr:unnamed protein product [Moneuplotes crassus]
MYFEANSRSGGQKRTSSGKVSISGVKRNKKIGSHDKSHTEKVSETKEQEEDFKRSQDYENLSKLDDMKIEKPATLASDADHKVLSHYKEINPALQEISLKNLPNDLTQRREKLAEIQTKAEANKRFVEDSLEESNKKIKKGLKHVKAIDEENLGEQEKLEHRLGDLRKERTEFEVRRVQKLGGIVNELYSERSELVAKSSKKMEKIKKSLNDLASGISQNINIQDQPETVKLLKDSCAELPHLPQHIDLNIKNVVKTDSPKNVKKLILGLESLTNKSSADLTVELKDYPEFANAESDLIEDASQIEEKMIDRINKALEELDEEAKEIPESSTHNLPHTSPSPRKPRTATDKSFKQSQPKTTKPYGSEYSAGVSEFPDGRSRKVIREAIFSDVDLLSDLEIDQILPDKLSNAFDKFEKSIENGVKKELSNIQKAQDQINKSQIEEQKHDPSFHSSSFKAEGKETEITLKICNLCKLMSKYDELILQKKESERIIDEENDAYYKTNRKKFFKGYVDGCGLCYYTNSRIRESSEKRRLVALKDEDKEMYNQLSKLVKDLKKAFKKLVESEIFHNSQNPGFLNLFSCYNENMEILQSQSKQHIPYGVTKFKQILSKSKTENSSSSILHKEPKESSKETISAALTKISNQLTHEIFLLKSSISEYIQKSHSTAPKPPSQSSSDPDPQPTDSSSQSPKTQKTLSQLTACLKACKQGFTDCQTQKKSFNRFISQKMKQKEEDYRYLKKEYDELYQKVGSTNEDNRKRQGALEKYFRSVDMVCGKVLKGFEITSTALGQKTAHLNDLTNKITKFNTKITSHNQKATAVNTKNLALITSLQKHIETLLTDKNSAFKNLRSLTVKIAEAIPENLIPEYKVDIDALHKQLSQEEASLAASVKELKHEIKLHYKITEESNKRKDIEMEEVMVQRAKCDLLEFVNQEVAQEVKDVEDEIDRLGIRERANEGGKVKGCNGCTVVYKNISELKNLSASAIVVPINEQLRVNNIANEYSGLDLKNNDHFKDKCDKFKKENYRLRTGLSTVFEAKKMKADNVIIAACPIINNTKGFSKQLMQKVILGILDKIIDYDFKSIIIPTFSNSISNFPDNIFKKLIKEEILKFTEQNSEMQDKEIILCLRSAKDGGYIEGKEDEIDQEETKEETKEESENDNPEDLKKKIQKVKERKNEIKQQYNELCSDFNELKEKNEQLEKDKREAINQLFEITRDDKYYQESNEEYKSASNDSNEECEEEALSRHNSMPCSKKKARNINDSSSGSSRKREKKSKKEKKEKNKLKEKYGCE